MAQTPAPLPIPQQSQPINPLAQSLAALARAVPNIDPEVAAAVAQGTQNPSAAVDAGQAAQGYTEATNTANFLKQQSRTNALASWNQLSASEQKLVSATGYRPPSTSRSIWGTITHDVGQGVHDTFNAAGSPLRAVQHGIRTVFAGANQAASGAVGYSWMLSPSEWAHAWNETSNGEHYILPSVQRQVQDQYGNQIYTLAMRLATGANATSIVSSAPANQQQQLAQQIQSDPKLHAALQALDAGHISFGRMLAYQTLGLKAGSTAGNLLSGASDAAIDWFGDPTVIGTKSAQSYGVARYLIGNGDDVYKTYQSQPAVQEAFKNIAEIRQSGDWATQIEQRYPKLVPMMDMLRDWNPSTADQVADMFADEANVRALISGSPGSVVGGVQGGILPNLTRTGQARLAAKGVLTRAIDWGADAPARVEGLQPGDVIDHELSRGDLTGPQRLETALGHGFRRLLTLTPTGDTFNANDPAWFNKLRDIAMMALPRARANQLLNEFATEATLGGRRNIYAGLLKEVQAAMGIDRIPGVSDWVDQTLNPNNLDSVISHQSYAPGVIDRVWRQGNPTAAGILRGDNTDEWAMPNFREMYAQSKKLGIMRAVNGSLNNQMVDTFMNQMWKPLALARFGFSVRVAGEEAFGFLLRNGPMAYLHAKSAGIMLHQQNLADNPDLHGRLASTWGWLTAHLPQSAMDRIKTPTDLIVEHMGDATSRAMAKVSGALAGEKYRDAVRLMADQGILDADGAFGRYVSAAESHGGGFYDQAMSELKGRVWNHGKWVQVRLSPTGAYTDYSPTAQPYIAAWYKRLHQMANDPWARVALENRGEDATTRLQAVADTLKADPAWTRASRSLVTTDGREVGPEATVDEAARDHAKAVIDLADSITQRDDGSEVPGLVDHLLTNRTPPTVAALDLIPEHERPLSVSGPEYIPVDSKGTGMFGAGINRMFSIIGKQIDWISRQPMFIHNFAVSMDSYRGMVPMWQEMGLRAEDIQKNLVTAATDRALKLTLPFIHNPEVRSQLEVIGRNVAPFMFAQDQFYKRWARTAVYSPWAFRQAQLINQGVYHSGFTHTDPTTGQQYFVYPGASIVQDVIARSLGVFGMSAFLPVEANLRGQVNMVSPGLERLGLPNLGPAVVVPMHFINQIFPETRGPAQAIEGAQTASASYMSSLVPTTVSRIWQDFTSTPNNSEQFASAMMQAIQYLEATGHGIGAVAENNLGNYAGAGAPPDQAGQKPGDYVTDRAGHVWVVQDDGVWRRNDPAALTAYMKRVQNWTRVFLITRTLFGFSVPASPEALFDPSHVNEDFQALLKELPYQQAVATFMQMHPDASAYTVFQTKNQAGAPLPATASAMQFMDANSQFFKDHPLAGAFFIPTQDSSGKYDSQAYHTQLQEQLRVRRTPTEFWQEIAYQNAATPYFNGESKKNQMMNGGGNYALIDKMWTEQSQEYMRANPLFAQQLADIGGSYTRSDIETDLGNALNDPNLPETPQTEDVRTLYNAWVMYQTVTAPYANPNGGSMSSSQRYQQELTFATEAQGWLQTHPDALPVFQRLMQPELSAALTSQAQGAAA